MSRYYSIDHHCECNLWDTVVMLDAGTGEDAVILGCADSDVDVILEALNKPIEPGADGL